MSENTLRVEVGPRKRKSVEEIEVERQRIAATAEHLSLDEQRLYKATTAIISGRERVGFGDALQIAARVLVALDCPEDDA